MGVDFAVELRFLHCVQNLLERGARGEAHFKEIVPSEKAGRANVLGRGLSEESANEVVGIKVPMAGEAIQAMQFKVLVEAV
jgi:hypothetical protein